MTLGDLDFSIGVSVTSFISGFSPAVLGDFERSGSLGSLMPLVTLGDCNFFMSFSIATSSSVIGAFAKYISDLSVGDFEKIVSAGETSSEWSDSGVFGTPIVPSFLGSGSIFSIGSFGFSANSIGDFCVVVSRAGDFTFSIFCASFLVGDFDSTRSSLGDFGISFSAILSDTSKSFSTGDFDFVISSNSSGTFGLCNSDFSKLSSRSCESRGSADNFSKLSSGVILSLPSGADFSEILSFSGVLMSECESLSKSNESLSGVDLADTSLRESSGVTVFVKVMLPLGQISVSSLPSSLHAVTNILLTVPSSNGFGIFAVNVS
ncbi:hypothetical protein ALC60_12543 [Trachymyrmex zeteki]|uniref:Uncharacterized protein n=1 Tax=Mycetomoellerius zeteki TaxID=64791 RepID=A0A151WKS0_9HYME|nr:hypothetical protein ALC60_12543 [Trachymyrmex zeteki]